MGRQADTAPPSPCQPTLTHGSSNAARIRIRWIAWGLASLATGFVYYATLRPASPPLVQALVGHRLLLAWSPTGTLAALFGACPAFLHVFAFSLLTAGILGPSSPRRAVSVALFWTGINVVFEVFQGMSPATLDRLAAAAPWKLTTLELFIRHGVFDLRDILAAVVGGFSAGLILVTTSAKGEHHVA